MGIHQLLARPVALLAAFGWRLPHAAPSWVRYFLSAGYERVAPAFTY